MTDRASSSKQFEEVLDLTRWQRLLTDTPAPHARSRAPTGVFGLTQSLQDTLRQLPADSALSAPVSALLRVVQRHEDVLEDEPGLFVPLCVNECSWEWNGRTLFGRRLRAAARQMDRTWIRRKSRPALSADPALLRTIRVKGELNSLCFSPDGRFFAAGSDHGSLYLWRAETGELLHQLETPVRSITHVAFSPTGNVVAAIGSDNAFRTWQTESGTPLAVVDGSVAVGRYAEPDQPPEKPNTYVLREGHSLGHLVFPADGRPRVVMRVSGRLIVWQPLAKETEEDYSRPMRAKVGDWTAGARLSPDGKALANAGLLSHELKVWNVRTGTVAWTAEIWGKGIWFSPDDRYLVTGGDFERQTGLLLWRARTGHEIRCLEGAAGFTQSVVFGPGGEWLAAGTVHGSILLWDIGSSKLRRVLRARSRINSMALSPDGTTLVTASEHAVLQFWRIEPLTAPSSAVRDEPFWISAHGLTAFSHDGRLLAVGGRKNEGVWNSASGTLVCRLSGFDGQINAIAFGGAGATILGLCDDGLLRVWDARTGRFTGLVSAEKTWGRAIALSGDGATLALALGEQIEFREFPGGTVLTRWAAPPDITSLAYARNGEFFAAATQESVIVVWKTGSGEQIAALGQEGGGINGIALSPDGRLLASARQDRRVRVWDVRAGTLLAGLPCAYPVQAVAFESDGATLRIKEETWPPRAEVVEIVFAA